MKAKRKYQFDFSADIRSLLCLLLLLCQLQAVYGQRGLENLVVPPPIESSIVDTGQHINGTAVEPNFEAQLNSADSNTVKEVAHYRDSITERAKEFIGGVGATPGDYISNIEGLIAVLSASNDERLDELQNGLAQLTAPESYLLVPENDRSEYFINGYEALLDKASLNVLAAMVAALPGASLQSRWSVEFDDGEEIPFPEADEISLFRKNNQLLRTLEDCKEAVQKVSTADANTEDTCYCYNRALKVYGFHSFDAYNRSTEHNYKLLHTICFIGYDIDDIDRSERFEVAWNTSNVFEHAKADKCRVELGVQGFNKQGMRSFLKDEKFQESLIDRWIELISDRDADGLHLNLEGLKFSQSEQYKQFVIRASRALKKENEAYTLTVTLPPIDYTGAYPIRAITSNVDYFIIMGYEYSSLHNPGPIAPLSDPDALGAGALDKTLEQYQERNLPNDKTILALPYYGAIWTKSGAERQYSRVVSRPPYEKVLRLVRPGSGRYFKDAASVRYKWTRGGVDTVVWSETGVGFGEKVKFVKESELAGVGIWALGFDGNHRDLEDQLIASAIGFDSVIVGGKQAFLQRLLGLPGSIGELWTTLLEIENAPPEVTAQVATYSGWISFGLFLAVLLILLLIYVGVRDKGESWKFKRMASYLVLLLLILAAASFILWAYTSNSVKWFGVGGGDIRFIHLIFFVAAGIPLWMLIQFIISFMRTKEVTT